MLVHSYDIMLILWIFIHQKFKKLTFLFSKFVINFCVTIYFYCNSFTGQMIDCRDNLSEATFAKNFDNFKAI